jgi:CheY-like chemotaxis protein
MESIGTLASGVAHDLNNILAPIMMSATMLRFELTAQQREETISTVETSAQRGAEIVRQVLAFGRGLDGERCPLQVAAVVCEIVKIMRETFPKDIVVANSLPLDLWQVLGNATQLHQVLLNLCVNARDAMPEGGEISFRASNFELDQSYASMLPGSTAGPNVLLEVRDNGIGISPEILERIFDPFFTTKAVGKGTGLGLSTVMGIVQSHGAHINVASEPGEGTTFRIYLPALRESKPPSGLTHFPTASPRGHGQCVLVVDDEEEVRRSTQVALENHGYQVLVAIDGVDALVVYARNAEKIGCVLTDLIMPQMSGLSLVQVLRRMAPLLPILVSTGLGKKTQLAELKRMQIETVLIKPYGTETLLQSIADALAAASDKAPAPVA